MEMFGGGMLEMVISGWFVDCVMYKLCKAKTICLDSRKILPIPFYLLLVIFLLSLCDVQIMSTECRLYSWIFGLFLSDFLYK